jgi:hypothetical protein
MSSNDHSALHRSGYAEQESAIMDLLRASGRLTVEEIVERIPDLSWSQLFLAMDVLSRTGEVILWREGFTYTLEAAKPAPVLETALHGTTVADHR